MNESKLLEAVNYLQAGDWKAAHEIVQQDEESALACWAHGIVHLMEGDLANARYWYRAARRDFPREPSAPEEIGALSAALRKESRR
jgi:Tfp pilus assembly protein PilF